MKRAITITIIVVLVAALGYSLFYLYGKNQEDPVVYETAEPEKRSIVKMTMATGSIVPKEEINIKPNVSGVIDKVHVQAGEYINAGDLIAEIKVVPNVSNLTSAKNSIQSARNELETSRLAKENAEKIYQRQKELFEKGVISANTFDIAQNDYNSALQRFKQQQVNLTSAQQNYDIIRTGTTSGLGSMANTNVRATVSGMVLDVPVKAGNQVIEANNFNEGTTIATIADVEKMIFEGKVDESEVGKIKEEMPLEVTVGAIEDKKFDAVLEYIAPKGVEENGAIQFNIKGRLNKADSTFIRVGLSANASVILARADSVLAVKEALIQYDEGKPYIEVMTGEQEFEKRNVKLGLSDGIYVQVIDGISAEDKIKIWNPIKKPAGRGSYGG